MGVHAQSVVLREGKLELKPILEIRAQDWTRFFSYFRDREIALLNGSNPIRMPLWLFKRVVIGEERCGERIGFGIYTLGESEGQEQFIGSVEFYELKPPPLGLATQIGPTEATLGILIGEKPLWGLGLGTQAVRMALGYAFEVLKLTKVRLNTLAHNTRARRAFEKAGFRFLELKVNERGQEYAHYVANREI